MGNASEKNALVALIDQCYQDIRAGQVSSVVFGCARISMKLRDPHSYSFFVTLQQNAKHEGGRAVLRAFPDIEREDLKKVQESSVDRVIGFYKLTESEREQLSAPPDSLLFYGANLLDSEIERCQRVLSTFDSPSGIPQELMKTYYFDTALPKANIIARIATLNRIKASILSACNSFLSEAENQIFATETAREAFAEISDATFSVLRSINGKSADQFSAAFKFFAQKNQEGYSASFVQIRRCLRTVADELCPPRDQEGLTAEKYLNRLCFYYENHAGKSPNVVQIEAISLEKLIRFLYERASKGVHSEVSESEARRVLMMAASLLSAIAEVEVRGNI